ncbi:MAG: diguanylate cyclase [Treponemataceae bacterium]
MSAEDSGDKKYDDLMRAYRKLEDRFSKVLTISDSYQAQLRDVLMRMDLMAHTDSLTGISNRRDMMDRLEIELARAERYGSSFSIASFDIDDFKRVNDLYGHDVGDIVLKQVAGAFTENIRRSDSCARWGGEEFLVLFPETVLAEAALGAEKCRAAVAALSFESGDDRFDVTVSGGLCSYRLSGELGELLKAADEALYRAKNQGKNRIVSIPLPGDLSSGTN